MDNQSYQIQWVQAIGEDNEIVNEEVITINGQDEVQSQQFFVQDIATIPTTLDQIAAENLIYMAQDGQVTGMDDLIEETVVDDQPPDYSEQQFFECQVTEEIITDDWVQQQGEERVEIPVDQLGGSRSSAGELVEEVDVPLPTDQDEYTALRPYPCDFCSRRFRKKVTLMNHMIAHQNDRSHVCNLCGTRYVRRNDLLNHLKIHAHVPDDNIDDIDDSYFNDHIEARPPRQNDYNQNNEYEEKHKIKTRGRGNRMKLKEPELSYSDQEDIETNVVDESPNISRYPIMDPKKPFVCQQCGVAFAREKALSSHSRIHGSDSPYECGSCSEMFWDMNTLNEHQRTHHFEASNSEYEPENDEETESDNDSKYGDFFCTICGMSFHRQDLLKRHSKSHIKNEENIGDSGHCCNVCGETFAEALDLLAHAEVHARTQPFKCMLCGETFYDEQTIKKHVANVHSDELTINSCKLCGKPCRDNRALMKHAWDHSREKNHPCSKCGKTFHNKARLKRHMVSHRNKTVICETCHEEFPDGRSLMNHRHSHTNSTGRLFTCNECGKTFGSRSSQQIHIRIHTGERPYGCRFCWKAFADGGTLRKHERIHTGEKPYACSVCPRAFNQRVVLREHIRSHHSGIDAKRGTYFCTVCSEVMLSSMELMQHLIHHSDMNTAMQRQPITGPRKYKRRRKLKPHEIERLSLTKNASDVDDYSDFAISNVDDLVLLEKKPKRRRKNSSTVSVSNIVSGSVSERIRKYSGTSDKSNSNWQAKLLSTGTDDSYSVFHNLENTLNNIDSLVVSNTTTSHSTGNTPKSTKIIKRRANKSEAADKPARPKMIHTKKTRIATDDGKRKTRTLITRTDPIEIDDQVFNQFDRTRKGRKRDNSIPSINSDYDIMLQSSQEQISPELIKHEQNTDRSELFDAQLLLEAASMRKEMDKYNPEVVQDLEDILRSPIKKSSPPNATSSASQSYSPESNEEHPLEDLRRSARIGRSVPNKKYLEFETSIKQVISVKSVNSVKAKTPKVEKHYVAIAKTANTANIQSRSIKKEVHECDLCSATFPEHDLLVAHVNIHF